MLTRKKNCTHIKENNINVIASFVTDMTGYSENEAMHFMVQNETDPFIDSRLRAMDRDLSEYIVMLAENYINLDTKILITKDLIVWILLARVFIYRVYIASIQNGKRFCVMMFSLPIEKIVMVKSLLIEPGGHRIAVLQGT